ncbi:MAG: hypothetical protein OEZ22_01620 [Spirochaetia bacterium]|nr:hypothetical protein [Spirochaetia bacterium]
MNKKPRALVLLSGGLDSAVAAKMLLEQNIDVIGIYFYTGFCITAQKAKTGRTDKKVSDAKLVADKLNIPLETIDISRKYLPLVSNPKFGYGKNINPCIDCRIFMLQEAKNLLEFYNADFVATGEIIDQRPKSQKKHTQLLIQKESKLENKLLRPLSAKLLPKTEPEEKGWLQRENLESINGRSRKKQLLLAKKWNISEFSTPAGGCCFLADETYSVRFKDLIKRRQAILNMNEIKSISHEEVILLGTGRHFKMTSNSKFICGRDESENNLLNHFKNDKIVLRAQENIPGPTGIFSSFITDKDMFNKQRTYLKDEFKNNWKINENIETINLINNFLEKNNIYLLPEEVFLAAQILTRYSDKKNNLTVTLSFENSKTNDNIIIVCDEYEDYNLLSKNNISKK